MKKILLLLATTLLFSSCIQKAVVTEMFPKGNDIHYRIDVNGFLTTYTTTEINNSQGDQSIDFYTEMKENDEFIAWSENKDKLRGVMIHQFKGNKDIAEKIHHAYDCRCMEAQAIPGANPEEPVKLFVSIQYSQIKQEK